MGPSLVRSVIVVLALVLACTPAAPPQPESPAAPAAPVEAEAPAPDPVEPMDQPPADELTGIFDIDRIAGGKQFQGSWLHRPDGESLVLSYRPMEEYLAFVEKRVVVRGQHYSPQGQAIGGPHFRVESMRLAEGETATATIPRSLPVPPRCLDHATLRERLDRWAQVVGTLVEARDLEVGGDWQDVVLRLDDGTELLVTETRWVVDRDYRPRFGTRVTMTGKLLLDEDRLRLGGATALCEGEVDGCGMTVQAVRR